MTRKLEWHVARNLLECAVDGLCGRTRPDGYEWELHRDFFVDDVTEDNVTEVATRCVREWDALRVWTHRGWRFNEAAIRDAVSQCWQHNRSMIEPDQRFNVERATEAIMRGQITPDNNEGAITSVLEAFAFGALMQAGPWWEVARG